MEEEATWLEADCDELAGALEDALPDLCFRLRIKAVNVTARATATKMPDDNPITKYLFVRLPGYFTI